MLQAKSFIVVGQTVTRNGQDEKDIADKVDAVINGYLSGTDGKVVQIVNSVQFGMSDRVFVTIVMDVDIPEPIKPAKKK